MKKSRHSKIIELIENYDIETQEELAEKVKAAGYQVTQATVSRDIREMRLTKIPCGNGKQKYYIMQKETGFLGERYGRVLKEGFVSMDNAQNILVVKTVSGMAMAVAAALDDMNLKQIVGVIAGDDTVMAAVRTVEDTYEVMDEIKKVLAQ